MILVDTSVWIDHLHDADTHLVALLDQGMVLTHPLVIGELAMGSIRERDTFLELLGELPTVPVASADEVLTLIEFRRLSGKGLGIVDAHLLAAALLAPGTSLWSRDARLVAESRRLRIDHL